MLDVSYVAIGAITPAIGVVALVSSAKMCRSENNCRNSGGSGAYVIHGGGSPGLSTLAMKLANKTSDQASVSFQFRDLRVSAATDTNDLAHAQQLLGVWKSNNYRNLHARKER